jgi:hypothetical protein
MATTGASLPTQPVGALLMAVSGAAFALAGRRRHQGAPSPLRPASVAANRG